MQAVFSTLNRLSKNFLKLHKLNGSFNSIIRSMNPYAADFEWNLKCFQIKEVLKIRRCLIKLFDNITKSPDDWDSETVSFSTDYLTLLRNDILQYAFVALE